MKIQNFFFPFVGCTLFLALGYIFGVSTTEYPPGIALFYIIIFSAICYFFD